MRRLPAFLFMVPALAACSGSLNIQGGSDDGDGPDVGDSYTNARDSRMARLTVDQYRNIVADVFGANALNAVNLESDVQVDGFSAIGALDSSASPSSVRKFESTGQAIADAAVADGNFFTTWAACGPANADDSSCYGQLAQNLGTRLFRRPLAQQEVDTYAALGVSSGTLKSDFTAGAKSVVTGLLNSPFFLYRMQGDGANNDKLRLASNLSFFLWNGAPDQSLNQAAMSGNLSSATAIKAEIQRLLTDSTRYNRSVRSFFGDLFIMKLLEQLTKDRSKFPDASPELFSDMRESTMRLAEAFAAPDADIRDIFTGGVAFVNDRLSPFYGGASSGDFSRTTLPGESVRVGLLTEPSFLAMSARARQTSPTLRGKFILERLLCQEVPVFPDNAATDIGDPAEGLTRREQVELHMENDQCRGCHKITDPVGLGLEQFDALGQVQDTDNGQPIDASGNLAGVAFQDAKGLSMAVRNDSRLVPCLVDRVLAHATGIAGGGINDALKQAVVNDFVQSGYRISALYSSVALRVLANINE